MKLFKQLAVTLLLALGIMLVSGQQPQLNCPGDCGCPGSQDNPKCQPSQDQCNTNPDLPCQILGTRGD